MLFLFFKLSSWTEFNNKRPLINEWSFVVKKVLKLDNYYRCLGLPFYLLIDKQGNIIEKGSHLRLGSTDVLEKIQELLARN